MKQFVILAVTGLVFFTQVHCFAGEDPSLFSNGFRQIEWGTHKIDLPDLGLSKKALKGIYASGDSNVLFMPEKGNLEMVFKSVPLLSIFLKFRDAAFSGVDMVFSKPDYQKALQSLTLEFGNPLASTDNGLEWQTDAVSVVLTDREIMVTSLHP
ncbi:MAG: hypothetical protein D3926_05765 [Desulfobacteraceae bacterium]|nr:MAG: hypothetical protein D3926_05765 [Desulfobacteraceae bacterium]